MTTPVDFEIQAMSDPDHEDSIVEVLYRGSSACWSHTSIRDIRGAWTAACKKAGYPGKLLHDFRRSAVRSLERSGVPRSVAMSMVGHKTEAIYRRYAIVDEAMLREGGARLDAFTIDQKAKAAIEAERRRGQLVQFEQRR